MALLTIKNLSFTYSLNNLPTLKNINLKINKGDFVVIAGTTGSGKSTLLKMLKKEIRPTGKFEGIIKLNNINLDEISLKESVTNFGLVMQDPHSQIVHEKVYSELAFGAENIGMPRDEIAIKVAEISNYFGINNWYNRNTSTLSGGEKQILNLASALIMNPLILLIDEPTSQLDPVTANEFIQTIKRINQDFGITILMIEHRLDELFPLCDRVIIMDEGKIIANENPKNIPLNIKDKKVFYNLPILYRIASKLDLNFLPLTIKEGQEVIDNFNNKIKELPTEVFNLQEKVYNLKSIYFKYNKFTNDILEDLSLQIYKNEIFTIVGSNGSGKSTLLKLMAKLQSPYYGKVIFNKLNIRKHKDEDLYYGNIAYLPQNPKDILLKPTVREEINYDNLNDEFILNLIHELELDKLLDKHPDDLSGGQVQQVALVKVLLQKPKVLLLDEPTKGMDFYLKLKFNKILEKLKLNFLTVVIVTHDLEFAALASTRVGLLFAGKIITINEPKTFFSNNYFYTTITNKISRNKYKNAVIEEDLIKLIKLNGGL